MIFDCIINLRFVSSFVFVFRKRLQDVFKTFWSRRVYSPWSYVFGRRLQDVFKTSWSRRIYLSWSYVFETSSRHFYHVFKTSSRRLQNVFKTSSRRLAKMSSRHLQDVFKTYHLIKLFLLTRLQNVIETYSARFWDALRRWLFTERFAWLKPLRNLWSGKKISRSELFGFTETLKTVFLKHFMK